MDGDAPSPRLSRRLVCSLPEAPEQILAVLLTRFCHLQPSAKVISVPRDRTLEGTRGRSTESRQKATTSPAPVTGRRATVHHGSAQENSDVDTGPGATGRTEARAPGTARTASLTGQEGKDARVDTLSRSSQDSGAASSGTQAPSLTSQDPRTAEGRRDQDETPAMARTGPARPRGRAAATPRTSVSESRAELPDAGAGLPGRRAEGATTAVAAAEQSTQATRPSACPQTPATRQSPRLQAADFKSEPRWDFEEKYSFDTGGLQTVSVRHCPCSLSPCSEAPPGRPPAPTLSFSSQAPLQPCRHPVPSFFPLVAEVGEKAGPRNPAGAAREGVSKKGPVLDPLECLQGHQSG